MEKLEVSAEIRYAQTLAANSKNIRDKAMKRLYNYLRKRSTAKGFTDEDFLKIHKGLFYCMWMQDKPLIQEELSQKITKLICCFSKTDDALRFVKVFFMTQAREWNGIDKLRLDKFLMMVRDMLHQTFLLLSNENWPDQDCIMLSRILAQQVMKPDKLQLPDGLKLHLADIFIDELVKVSIEKMTSKTVVILLLPFLLFILNSNKIELVKRILQSVVYKVVEQFTEKQNNSDLQHESVPEQQSTTEDMEVDKEKPSFVLDKKLLLLLLFKQAEQKKIKAPNRALVYKFVKKFPEERDLITNVIINKKELESKNEQDLRNLEDLLLDFDGEAVEQQKTQKSKGKKMHCVVAPSKNSEQECSIKENIKKKRKKRQRPESPSSEPSSKKSKIAPERETFAAVSESATLEVSSDQNGQPSLDFNSNARSRSLSPRKPTPGSIELVTYPQNGPSEPTTPIVVNKIHETAPKKRLSSSPSKDLPKFSIGSPPKLNDMVSKCNTDPGPSCGNKNSKSFSTPGISMTPGIKKKVVFDLRKNKANKFKDYLQSLAQQPDPPYEPSKSPSVSILKQSNNQPITSDKAADNTQVSSNQVSKSPKKRSASLKKHKL